MHEISQNTCYPEEGEVILIDKDLDWTSFNVVKKIKFVLLHKYRLKKLKVGHAGTLDPLATGLMILCTGRQTKNIELYQAQEKEYVASIRLDSTTPSFDLETEPDHFFNVYHIAERDVKMALNSFLGEQDQVPPAFSAKYVDGKRAYKLAREGKTVELQASRVNFYSLELLKFDLPVVEIKIVCSKGTYIRSFARDLGIALGAGGHLAELRRTRIGTYRVEDAYTVRNFEENIRKL